jgi:hypothetical protein
VARAAVDACHELLLLLAGRLPDDVAWRLRDWLADDTDGGRAAVAATLPRALLRNRVGITDHERSLLLTTIGDDGAVRRTVGAILPVGAPERPAFEFRAAPDRWDAAQLAVLAVARGTSGVREVLRSVRSGPFGERTVHVVLGGDRPWALTGTLQRLLRAHGERTPCVEVLPVDLDPPPYHKAAIVGSAPVWSATAVPAAAASS